jgi:hypothetical protein
MRRLLTILLVLVPMWAWATVPDPCSHYAFSRTITIDHTKVPNTDQTNFVVGIIGTYSYLAVAGSGGDIQHTAANSVGVTGPTDLAFCLGSKPNQPLSYEVSRYVTATGEINVWVLVPSLSHTVDTVLYIGYGNSAITTTQQNVPDVWTTAGYTYVLHMEGASTDSNGLFNGTDTATSYGTGNGKVGQGVASNGTTTSIALAASTKNDPSPITFEAWANATSFPNAYNSVEATEAGANGHTLLIKSTGKLAIYLSPGANYDGTGSNTLSSATWYHLAFTYSAANKLKGYVNGSVDGTSASTWTGSAASIAPLIANSTSASRHWNGSLDEIRLSAAERSADWLTTSYNNQNSPSTFYTVGSAVAGSSCTTGYQSQAVTIDHTKVPNTDRSNYQFLFTGTYGCLATTGNGGSVANVNGYDIGLFSDALCTTRLATETPLWNATTGSIQLWGLLASVSHTVDKTVYLCFGSSSITTDQSNVSGVWGSNGYVGVYHWGNPSSLVTTDSGSAGLDVGTGAAGSPMPTVGPFGFSSGSVHFDGASSEGWVPTGVDSIGAHGYPTGSAKLHFSLWTRKGLNTVCNDCTFGGFGKANGLGATQLAIEQRTCVLVGYTVGSLALGSPSITTTDNAGCGGSTSTPNYTNDPGWHKWEIDYPSNGGAVSTMTVYLDGLPVTSPFFFSSATVPNTDNANGVSGGPAEVRIGRDAGHGVDLFTGDVGQWEVNTNSIDADTVKTRYNNESSPATFYSLGALAPVTSGFVRHRVNVY